MTYTTKAFQEFLSSKTLLSQLPGDVLAEVATKFKPWRYRMGQAILMRGKMPEQIFVLYEGKARSLGFDPRTEIPTTLELLQPGAILGWMDWVRGVPCETAIASSETICLALELAEFEKLLEEYPQLQASFRDRSTPIEVFDLLGRQLEEQARGEGELRKITAELLADIQVHHLYSGRDFDTGLAAEKVWLVSSSAAANYPVSSRFNPAEPPQFANGKPLRLIGLPADWAERLLPTSRGGASVPAPDASVPARTVEIGRAHV